MPNPSVEQIQLFLLIFLRVSAIVALTPILGDRTVPLRVKGGLSILIAGLLFPVVRVEMPALAFDTVSLFFRMASELIIGVVIGFAARLVFAGIQLAGQLVGFQMGFSIVNVIDPVNSMEVSIIAEFQYLVAVLIFLGMNGHHLFLSALADSFRLIPPLGFHLKGGLMQTMLGSMKDMFEVAIRMGAPIIAMLFFTSVGLGLVARTVPQINIFIVGFPLQIAIGLIGIGITLPLFVTAAARSFSNLEQEVQALLRLM
jgi:flagellar biosynthetic protein FliR